MFLFASLLRRPVVSKATACRNEPATVGGFQKLVPPPELNQSRDREKHPSQTVPTNQDGSGQREVDRTLQGGCPLFFPRPRRTTDASRSGGVVNCAVKKRSVQEDVIVGVPMRHPFGTRGKVRDHSNLTAKRIFQKRRFLAREPYGFGSNQKSKSNFEPFGTIHPVRKPPKQVDRVLAVPFDFRDSQGNGVGVELHGVGFTEVKVFGRVS